ncbi:16S rRNA (uracil(1498)-N(3))-methyltransferase [Gilvimarinus sp. F26214L]|uniref:16S rRNA (uracil(1498)-N(3))-methyltransferase n=1 Tax=Gilvimarinus sp. DZF01 TaxID=3461371 RepID=UPI0040464076
MRIPRLYVDLPLETGGRIDLPPDRAHYIVNVLRLVPGRPLILFNGQGGEYGGTLVGAGKKTATVQLDSFEAVSRESPLVLDLAIGISRGDRMDWVLQKATELGVSSISPLYTERTEVKLKGDRLHKKMEHWRQVIISACEQSQRVRVPELKTPVDFPTAVAGCESERRLLLHPTGEPAALDAQQRPVNVSVLVGPEGGFSDDEVSLALRHGFEGWQLGPRVLRTETAPLAAISLLQHFWGDMACH